MLVGELVTVKVNGDFNLLLVLLGLSTNVSYEEGAHNTFSGLRRLTCGLCLRVRRLLCALPCRNSDLVEGAHQVVVLSTQELCNLQPNSFFGINVEHDPCRLVELGNSLVSVKKDATFID